MSANQTPTATIGRWLLLWTSIGCVFALQLRWYHELPWSLSIFWGLADWYLWGLIALLADSAIRRLKQFRTALPSRLILYGILAPVIAALHVVLTMLVALAAGFELDTQWFESFQSLYAKKLTLNLLTFAAIVVVIERWSNHRQEKNKYFSTKLGDVTRLVSADQIIWGEVSGNYVNLHTQDGVWPFRDTLTGLLNQLPTGEFVRISRSAMISMKQVHEQRSDEGSLNLTLKNGANVRVSRRYRGLVRQALKDHCSSEPQA